jgi:hypothetical protein
VGSWGWKKGEERREVEVCEGRNGLSWIGLSSEYNGWWDTSTLASCWVVILSKPFWVKFRSELLDSSKREEHM